MRALLSLMLVACGSSRGRVPVESADPVPGRFAEAPPAGAPRFPVCDDHRVSPSDPDKVLVTLERSACLGWCPVYTVVVFRDGLVQYTGSQFVMTCSGIAHLGPDPLQQLADVFLDAGFEKLDSSYTEPEMTDSATITTSYSPRPGQTKTIIHYAGDTHAPPTLRAVEDAIDRIVDIEQFIGSEQERESAFHARP